VFHFGDVPDGFRIECTPARAGVALRVQLAFERGARVGGAASTEGEGERDGGDSDQCESADAEEQQVPAIEAPGRLRLPVRTRLRRHERGRIAASSGPGSVRPGRYVGGSS
jgi:hypothetical protein